MIFDLANKTQVSFNQEENKFIVKLGGIEYEFIPKHKLYVHQAYNRKRKGVYVQTVEENEKMFTERQKKMRLWHAKHRCAWDIVV